MLDKALSTVIMPFGIKLRRTGRYILSHKNSFLIRVQLLDNSAMECTLTVENTGADCLNAVAQRLELTETRYFGLRYFNKQMRPRWVELDKPLKKQVDKNSHEPILFFGVMFYVANIDRLQHEMTRYLFYLQLKNNVIEGVLPCRKIEAVELASYVLQAEFADHDPEKHTVDLFRDYILFPEFLTPNDPVLDALTQQAIDQHKRHSGLSPSDAEYNYILKAIHLDGFSEDLYPAKNGFGNDVEVGCSFAGVVIKSIQQDMGSHHSLNTTAVWRTTCHEWGKVEHIAHHSKNVVTIEIRTESAMSPVHFQLEDGDTAKYLWRICEAKRKFYMQNKDYMQSKRVALESGSSNFIQRRPTLRRNRDLSSDELSDHQMMQVSMSGDFISSQENLPNHTNAEIGQYYSSQTSLDHAYVSQTSLNHHPHDAGYSNGMVASGSMYSSPSINSLAQTHLSHLSPATSNMSISSSDRRLGVNPVMVSHVGIPRYRPSPDYEVAVRQRRRYSSYLENNNMGINQQPHTSISQAEMKPRPHSMIYSPQELLQQAIQGPYYAQYPHQHPPLHLRRSQPPMDPSTAGSQPPMDPSTAGSQPPMDPSTAGSQPHIHYDASHESLSQPGNPPPPMDATRAPYNIGSTPELANTIQQQASKHFYVSELQLYRHFTKAPPPYLDGGSTSTPDLTDYRQNGAMSVSNPDLHVGNPQRRHQPLPTVESGSEDVYNEQQIRDHLTPHQHSASVQPTHQSPPTYEQPTEHTGNRIDQISRQENAVLAYLQRLNLEEQKMNDQQRREPKSNPHQTPHVPGSGLAGESPNQSMYNQSPQSTSFDGQPEMSYRHMKEESNATMLVYSDDEPTDDYMMSQQLQEQARKAHRGKKFLHHMLPQGGVIEHMAVPPAEPQPTPHVFPDPPHGEVGEETRGPPPPYHTPSPTLFDDDSQETAIDDETITLSGSAVGSAMGSRRNTAPEVPPLKLNGQLQRQTSWPVSGELDERVTNLDAKVSGNHVLAEYDEICRTRRGQFDLDSMTSRDRVREVIPYRDCRVTLTPTDDNPTGYINASHITIDVAGHSNKYIACQTPMESYQDEFWQMVWQQRVTIIVLLAKEMEHGKCRCPRYWPDEHNVSFDDITITCRFSTAEGGRKRVTRSLHVQRGGDTRVVWMLQYLGWPETGVPKATTEFLEFMEELESIRRLNEDDSPVVVQCASGSGRSGVLILTELMIQSLEHNQDMEIATMLSLLRHQRMHMVQTFSQYNFVYKLLISFLSKSRLI